MVILYGENTWLMGILSSYFNFAKITHTIGKLPSYDNGVIDEIKKNNAKYVIYCANSEKTFYKNGFQEMFIRYHAPLKLAFSCAKAKVHMTYFASSSILEGKLCTENGFKENERINLETNNLMGLSNDLLSNFTNVLILRLTNPTWNVEHTNNFLTKAINGNVQYKLVSVSVLKDVLPIYVNMLKDNVVGTYNLNNTGYIDMEQLYELIEKKLHRDVNKKTDYIGNFIINNDKLNSICNNKIPNAMNSLETFLDNWDSVNSSKEEGEKENPKGEEQKNSKEEEDESKNKNVNFNLEKNEEYRYDDINISDNIPNLYLNREELKIN